MRLIDNDIEEKETTIDELLDVVKGPDFPTGGIILGTSGIKAVSYTHLDVFKRQAIGPRIEPGYAVNKMSDIKTSIAAMEPDHTHPYNSNLLIGPKTTSICSSVYPNFFNLSYSFSPFIIGTHNFLLSYLMNKFH